MEYGTLDALVSTTTLGAARKGFRGTVVSVLPIEGVGRLPADEMERRLVEMGFIEGAEIEIIHEGPIRRDPIAVRVGSATVALRRRDALAILAE
ncbi:MAG TPA: ferrous iron transport protein A [Rhodobacteraceae bacterium]|nr:ferrous iron transport protein A [Paracoccaceae bacterium]